MNKNEKLKIGFLAEPLDSNSTRGAARLFRTLVLELSLREDVELYALYERSAAELNPVASIFRYRQFKNGHALEDNPFGRKVNLNDIECFFIKRPPVLTGYLKKFRAGYRKYFPGLIRNVLRPVNWLLANVVWSIYNSQKPRLQLIREKMLRRGYNKFTFSSFLKMLFSPDTELGSPNEQVVSEYVSIAEFDVVLNFWWFHSPTHNELLGLYRPLSVLVYSWFLDAIPLRLPHWQDGLIGESHFRRHVGPHLQMSDRIVAISESAAYDLQAFFPMQEDKVVVVPCGIFEKDFLEHNSETDRDLEGTMARIFLRSGIPIVMIIGVQEPSKNVVNILKACHYAIRQGNSNFQLLFVGEHSGFDPHQRFGPILDKVNSNINIIFSGTISENDKCALLAGASVLLYPSLWEGFGIPPLEAMAAGVPVLISDLASLPEVCGEHATYCDPYDPVDIGEKLIELLEMPAERREILVMQAKEYARKWLWGHRAVPLLITDIREQIMKVRSFE